VTLSALHDALSEKDLERTLRLAGALDDVPLRFAARIVYLMAIKAHPRYKPAARRFLARVAEELQPPLEEVWKLANCLVFVHDPRYADIAQENLRQAIGQIHRRERIDLDFNGGF
jgi:hypothetical protein